MAMMMIMMMMMNRFCVNRGGSGTAATSKMEHFVIIVGGWKPLTIITKHSILDVPTGLDPPLIMAEQWKVLNFVFSQDHVFFFLNNLFTKNEKCYTFQQLRLEKSYVLGFAIKNSQISTFSKNVFQKRSKFGYYLRIPLFSFLKGRTLDLFVLHN